MPAASVSFEAEVVAVFGRGLLVRDATGALLEARPFGRRVSAVCGDRVRCDRNAHGEVLVRETRDRRTALHRTTNRGTAEIVAANLTTVAVVIAPTPPADCFVVDRYLCAAGSAAIDALIIVNKLDLGLGQELSAEIGIWRAVGYEVLPLSVHADDGLADLEARFAKGTAILVGPSGSGKSSLLNRLAPDAAAQTGELVRSTGEGRHTTSSARLHQLPSGGRLIDSPGVRDFAPAIQYLDARTLGFPEVAARAPGCRFADCRHVREPGCAVREAAERGEIAPRRHESYRRLRRLYEELNAARGYVRE
jgi:ribosome biogenesis GTPase